MRYLLAALAAIAAFTVASKARRPRPQEPPPLDFPFDLEPDPRFRTLK